MSTTDTTQEHFTTILHYRIKFWLRGENAPTELDEASIEHIQKHLADDYREGELCVTDGDDEFRGWWQIDFS